MLVDETGVVALSLGDFCRGLKGCDCCGVVVRLVGNCLHDAVGEGRGGGEASECAVAGAVVVLDVVHSASALPIGTGVILRLELGAGRGRGELVPRDLGDGVHGAECFPAGTAQLPAAGGDADGQSRRRRAGQRRQRVSGRGLPLRDVVAARPRATQSPIRHSPQHPHCRPKTERRD